jgi:FAD dependent oxidoreductase TIGR03364
MGVQTDVAVVGAGFVGLSHAWAAARRGLKVTVIDRDTQANGASVRNFGFVTVTGQQHGEPWRRARRSRDVWAEIAPAAGIELCHAGLALAIRRPEAEAVVDAFLATEMGADCQLLTPAAARVRVPRLKETGIRCVLWSPHELRVESRDAIPRFAGYLERAFGVRFLRHTLVTGIDLPHIETTSGPIRAEAAIVCPGDDYLTLFAGRIRAYQLTRCLLQMMRIWPAEPIKLGAAVMSDLSLLRYLGYAELAPAAALRRAVEQEEPEMLAHGIHLIAVQSQDGTLVVGDSHRYHPTPPPFAEAHVEGLILSELDRVLDLPGRQIREHWVGVYASSNDCLMLIDRPADRVRIVIVTSGTGLSTAFAIAEETIGELC